MDVFSDYVCQKLAFFFDKNGWIAFLHFYAGFLENS